MTMDDIERYKQNPDWWTRYQLVSEVKRLRIALEAEISVSDKMRDMLARADGELEELRGELTTAQTWQEHLLKFNAELEAECNVANARTERIKKDYANYRKLFWLHKDERDQLKVELEQLRVQLAGCGVAAMCNTHQSMRAQQVMPGDYGYSASYRSVVDAVKREIDYREALSLIERGAFVLGLAMCQATARETLQKYSGDSHA